MKKVIGIILIVFSIIAISLGILLLIDQMDTNQSDVFNSEDVVLETKTLEIKEDKFGLINQNKYLKYSGKVTFEIKNLYNLKDDDIKSIIINRINSYLDYLFDDQLKCTDLSKCNNELDLNNNINEFNETLNSYEIKIINFESLKFEYAEENEQK